MEESNASVENKGNDAENLAVEDSSLSHTAISEENIEEKNPKNVDPYAYLQREEFCSENFKIEILNLPKYFGIGELKKFLLKQQIQVHKLKTMGKAGKFVFANFKSEEERQKGMEKLKGLTFKGKVLDVKTAKPMQDPLIKKRKEEADSGKKSPITESLEKQIARRSAPYSDMPYSEQLNLKKQSMNTVLEKLTAEISKAHFQAKPFIREQKNVNAGLICPLVDLVPSPILKKYRNKCEFTAGVNPESNDLTLGFRVSSYKEGSYAVGPIGHLKFIPDAMKEAVKLLEIHMRASGLKPYNPEDHSGFWRQVLMRANLKEEVMVVVTVHPQNYSSTEMDSVKNGLKSLMTGATFITSLYFQSLGMKESGKEPPLEHLTGATTLQESICGLEFSISPLAFFQANSLAAEVLYDKIGELAQVDADTTVLDVCCGTGTIGLSLAKKCSKVFGIDMTPSAIEDARTNAEKNGITNCTYVVGKAEDELPALVKMIVDKSASEKDDRVSNKIVAIVDPPRAGLHSRSCRLLRSMSQIDRLIYVSCDAGAAMKSFVDLCRAESNAYVGVPFMPVMALAIDLFPDTPHCELILVMERYRPKT